MSQSAFVISLDFEQHWGVYDHSTVNAYRRKLDGGRRAIPQILQRFDAAGICIPFPQRDVHFSGFDGPNTLLTQPNSG